MQRCLFLLLFLASLALRGQVPPSVLGGARSTALGQASVALLHPWSALHNQAATAFLENSSLGINYQNRFLLPGLELGHAFVVLPLNWQGSLGFNGDFLGNANYGASRLGLSYAQAFSPQLAFGLQLNYHRSAVSEGPDLGAVTYEISVFYRPTDKLDLGFQAINPSGEEWSGEAVQALPSLGRLGMTYRFSDAVLLSAEAASDLRYGERYGLGFEYGLWRFLDLRCGLAATEEYFATAGMGLHWEEFSLALAYEYGFLLGNNLSYSLQWSW